MNLYDLIVAKKLSGGGGGGSAVIESLSVTENGTYTAGEGVDGFSPVEVNVPASGGITADDIAMKTISGVVSGSASVIKTNAFAMNSLISRAEFPNAINIEGGAFNLCSKMTEASFRSAQTIAMSAFSGCYSLKTLCVPNVVSVQDSAFYNCSALKEFNAPSASNIGACAFFSCSNLSKAYIPDHLHLRIALLSNHCILTKQHTYILHLKGVITYQR